MLNDGKSSDFSIFDNEERVIKQAEELANSFDEHAKLVHENMQSLAIGYRRSFREQQRLIRLSDRQQGQLRNITIELQEANNRLEEQATRLAELNAALEEEIKQKKLLEAELRAIATTDALTGVYTRRQLIEFGENEIKRFLRTKRPLCILMLDIDHFKNINDTHGHAAGDAALKCFTAICQESIRTTDILGRIGGEEFVVIISETHGEEAFEVAERIRKNVEAKEFLIEDLGLSLKVTVSIGAYSAVDTDSSFEQIMIKADNALYEAKRGGRNSVIIYKEVI
jgi:diguanylate cyclase (GGDEF)-like protein